MALLRQALVLKVAVATGFLPGFMIGPAFGAALMSVSTIICTVNAQLLERAASQERELVKAHRGGRLRISNGTRIGYRGEDSIFFVGTFFGRFLRTL